MSLIRITTDYRVIPEELPGPFICPRCGEFHDESDDPDPAGEVATCPKCGQEVRG